MRLNQVTGYKTRQIAPLDAPIVECSPPIRILYYAGRVYWAEHLVLGAPANQGTTAKLEHKAGWVQASLRRLIDDGERATETTDREGVGLPRENVMVRRASGTKTVLRGVDTS